MPGRAAGILRFLLLAGVIVPWPACHRATPPDGAPVVIIIADGLRHDFAELRDYTPDPGGVSRLAAQATTFTKCVTTVGMTRGSFPGLLSGQMTGTLDEKARRSSWISRLRQNGYTTAFIASSYAFGPGPSSVDIGPLFDEVHLENNPKRVARPMPEALSIFDAVLSRRRSDRILVVLHLFYPHAPYWRISYGDSVTQLDRQIAEALRVLDRRGLYDRAHVVLTSDHGETLQEHDSPPQHGWTVYGEETRIPLLWKTPGQKSQHLETALVRNYDIGPTIVRSADPGVPPERAGLPIAAIAGGRHVPRVAFQTALVSRMYPVPQIALRTDRHVLIQNSEGSPTTELYDFEADPAELYNIAGTEQGRKIVRDLAPRLAALKQAWIDTELEKRDSLSAEMRQTLKSLGYLGTGPSTAQRGGVVEAEAAGRVRLKFLECFSKPWARAAGDTYDSLFPERLVSSGGELFVIGNVSRDVSRLHHSAGRVRPADVRGAMTDEVWFQRRRYQLAPSSGEGMLALFEGRSLKLLYADPHDYRLDQDGHTYGREVARLEREYDDLIDAPGLGVILFAKDGVFLRRADGTVTLLARYSSDARRTAYSQSERAVYIADGQWIFRASDGASPTLFKDAGAQILSVAVRGGELWVGMSPFPPGPSNREPVVIYDLATGARIGTFGARVVTESPAFWASIDVGPFGFAFPAQIVFAGSRLYVLDSGLERILAYDVRELR